MFNRFFVNNDNCYCSSDFDENENCSQNSNQSIDNKDEKNNETDENESDKNESDKNENNENENKHKNDTKESENEQSDNDDINEGTLFDDAFAQEEKGHDINNNRFSHIEELRTELQHGYQPTVNVIGTMQTPFEIKQSKSSGKSYVSGVALSCLKSTIDVIQWNYDSRAYSIKPQKVCLLCNVRIRHLGDTPYILMSNSSFILNKFNSETLQIIMKNVKSFQEKNKATIKPLNCMYFF